MYTYYITRPKWYGENLIFHPFYSFKGYVIVKDFFTKEELEPCKKAIERFVDQLAHKLYNAGKIDGKIWMLQRKQQMTFELCLLVLDWV